MKLIFIFLMLFILAGCESGKTIEGKPTADVTYFRDEKASICFARYNSVTHSGYTVVSIATVPCEKVERFLK